MVINHNEMAANTARNLNSHYGRLQTSTQRLSTGLRINSAADDAAGLAIRELMRSDIASLNQGVRNANDAISLIQVADGALGIIDEKLIRMKELAEQAATGTYNSDQRLMINSEFQAMGAEIDRIAFATNFNANIFWMVRGVSGTMVLAWKLPANSRFILARQMIPQKTITISALATPPYGAWAWPRRHRTGGTRRKLTSRTERSLLTSRALWPARQAPMAYRACRALIFSTFPLA